MGAVAQSLVDGRAAFAAGNFDQAGTHFDFALAHGADNRAEILCNRAACMLKLGRYADAECDAAEATHFETGYVKAYYRLALAQRGLGKLSRATKACSTALELQPPVMQESQLIKLLKEIEAEARCDSGRVVSAAETCSWVTAS